MFNNNSKTFDEINHPNNISPKIKTLVEISNSKIEFQKNKEIKISNQINEILDIEWETTSVEYDINLSASLLRLSSSIIAKVSYTKNTNNQMYMYTIPVAWKKTCKIVYSHPPVLPKINEKYKYQYTNHLNHEATQFEQVIYTNEKPLLDVISTRIITGKYQFMRHDHNYLDLDINIELSYRIFQHQVLNG